MDGWQRDGMNLHLTLTLSPTLCAMLRDPLLQDRYTRHLHGLIDLAEKEIHRTHWDRAFRELAWMYHHRFTTLQNAYLTGGHNLVSGFRKFQNLNKLEIITTSATHALLPLLASHPPAVRAQILVARDHYCECFGGELERGRGFWFNVDAELIIYGATERDASVTIGGRKIQLRADGSFSYRFALPDGRYDLPVVAVSADETDARAAGLRFSRTTELLGEVGAQPQDPALTAPTAENV